VQPLDRHLIQAVDPVMRGRVLTVFAAGLMFLQGVTIAAGGAVAEILPPGATLAGAGVVGLLVVARVGPRAAAAGRRRDGRIVL
jgi:hypothetical protein